MNKLIGIFLVVSSLVLGGCGGDSTVLAEGEGLNETGKRVSKMFINARGTEKPVNRIKMYKYGEGGFAITASNYTQAECDNRKELDEPCGYAYGIQFADEEGIKTFIRAIRESENGKELSLDVDLRAYSYTGLSSNSNDEISLELSLFPIQGYIVITGSPLYNKSSVKNGSFIIHKSEVLALYNLLDGMFKQL
jgi:hypothetical protein